MSENQGSILRKYLVGLKGGIKGVANNETDRSFLNRHLKKKIVDEKLKDFLRGKNIDADAIINEHRNTIIKQSFTTNGENRTLIMQFEELRKEIRELREVLSKTIQTQAETIESLLKK